MSTNETPPSAAPCPSMLLVDDNDAFREITAIALGSLGYTVQTCSSPEDAIASARTKAPYALLMTDVIMANMNGIQLAAEVRRSLPDIKVLFCSGYPEAVLERQGLDLGIGEFLLKPIALGELASTLKAVLLPPVATSTA